MNIHFDKDEIDTYLKNELDKYLKNFVSESIFNKSGLRPGITDSVKKHVADILDDKMPEYMNSVQGLSDKIDGKLESEKWAQSSINRLSDSLKKLRDCLYAYGIRIDAPTECFKCGKSELAEHLQLCGFGDGFFCMSCKLDHMDRMGGEE